MSKTPMQNLKDEIRKYMMAQDKLAAAEKEFRDLKLLELPTPNTRH